EAKGSHAMSLHHVVADWPTPQTHDTRQRGNTMADNHHYPHDLSNAAEGWPTPKSRDWKGGQGAKERHSPDLDKVAEASFPQAATPTPGEPSPSNGGRPYLNPSFVEWLMGLPAGWTSLAPSASTSSGTASYRYR